LERIDKKVHYLLEHLLVFLQTVLQDARFNHQDSTIKMFLVYYGVVVRDITEK
jgi:hypothetical protein